MRRDQVAVNLRDVTQLDQVRSWSSQVRVAENEIEDRSRNELMVQLLIAEERSEDPLIMTFDAVVSKH